MDSEIERLQRERPGIEDLPAEDYDGPYRHGNIIAFLSALAAFKAERERRGLTLAVISERSNLDKGMLSRLENGKLLNPTIGTLWRYAEAIGVDVAISPKAREDGPNPPSR